MEGTMRKPLKDIGVNSPSIKRQKLLESLNSPQRYDLHLRMKQAQEESTLREEDQEISEQLHKRSGYTRDQGPEYQRLKRIANGDEALAGLHEQRLQRDHTRDHTRDHDAELIQRQQQQQAIPLAEWQRKWRKIMRESVIYFDSNDPSVFDLKKKEKEQAIKLFTQVGASIQQFFDNRVTIVVSNRPKNSISSSMAKFSSTLKFWNYEKVFRFLKHLGEVPSPEHSSISQSSRHLSTMLQDEKIHGSYDRDPNAKRDDFNYFKYPHFYVYDLRQVIKPVALREWKIKDPSDSKKPWPYLQSSTYGHSLFTPDPVNAHDPKKRERRRLRDEQNKKHRDKLKAVYSRTPITYDNTKADTESEEEVDSFICNTTNTESTNTIQMPPPHPVQSNLTLPENPLLSRQASLINNKFIESTKRDNFEIEASGYAGGSTNVSNQSNEQISKNGLIAPTSTVPSKQVNYLQRKLIERKSKLSTQEKIIQQQKQKIPGYCENCRIHFDDFDEHCVSISHRNFAKCDENFESIDELIMLLQESIRHKR